MAHLMFTLQGPAPCPAPREQPVALEGRRLSRGVGLTISGAKSGQLQACAEDSMQDVCLGN